RLTFLSPFRCTYVCKCAIGIFKESDAGTNMQKPAQNVRQKTILQYLISRMGRKRQIDDYENRDAHSCIASPVSGSLHPRGFGRPPDSRRGVRTVSPNSNPCLWRAP